MSLAGKLWAFMLSFWTQSEHVHSCVRSKKHAFGQAPAMFPRVWRQQPYYVRNDAFGCSPPTLLTTMLLCSFFFFGLRSGVAQGRRGIVRLLTIVAACFQHGRGHIPGQGQSVALVKSTVIWNITTALISDKNNAKNTFWEGINSVPLDVSCSFLLCSIDYFLGRHWCFYLTFYRAFRWKQVAGILKKEVCVAILSKPDCFNKTQTQYFDGRFNGVGLRRSDWRCSLYVYRWSYPAVNSTEDTEVRGKSRADTLTLQAFISDLWWATPATDKADWQQGSQLDSL